ncbi:uncharacterized protein [Lepeophtheirus salmonis]|uniref:uncharacterized protein n=1 Tax=Lepeophtheirus salmonis TaxID=72036 RepID=UPI001AEB00F9|nr:uncharacterized protein LOC121126467 isoform X2 [Lepeophtheirus salmonis]
MMLYIIVILLSILNRNEAFAIDLILPSTPLPNGLMGSESTSDKSEQINENALMAILSRVKDRIEGIEQDLNKEIDNRKRLQNLTRKKRSAEGGDSKTHPALIELNNKMSEVASSIDQVMTFLSSKVQKKKNDGGESKDDAKSNENMAKEEDVGSGASPS